MVQSIMEVLSRLNHRELIPLKITYPHARRTGHTDVIHGVTVQDPYRWMEDIDSPETRGWITEQNKLTGSILEKIPQREAIKQRMTSLWNFEKYGTPTSRDGRLIYTLNDGLQNQSVLYVQDKDSEPRVLLDPNKLSADGTVALMGASPSDDGSLLAYGLAEAGSDWQEWKIKDVDTGVDLPDHLRWMKHTEASWTADNRGFYYSRYDEPTGELLKEANFYQKLCYHRTGTSQEEDTLVYSRDDHKDWRFSGEVSKDDRYLIVTVTRGTYAQNQVFLLDLKEDKPVRLLIEGFSHKYRYLDNDGPVYYFYTDHDAPMSRVVSIDIEGDLKPVIVLPESTDALRTVKVVNNQLVTEYLHDAYSVVKVYSKAGEPLWTDTPPSMGTVTGFSGGKKDREAYYHFASFTDPGTIYRMDMEKETSTVYRQPSLGYNPGDYVTEQRFIQSKDGTMVPMFLTYRKGTELRDRWVYLYGYGGFNISLTPFFNVRNLVWMERGGVYAHACLRGGAEYGKPWHEAGIKQRKQNVFDDYIAAAEYLIMQGVTSTPRLAISGRSNGGLLAGACLTQRPELYGVVLPIVGVLDMLRFEKFTVGWGWVSDYGTVEDPEEFKALHAYSPLHNLGEADYPPTLVTTGDHDDRVYPAHSFKFAAELQHMQRGDSPTLIRVDTRAGHGGGKPTGKLIEEYTDELAFIEAYLEK